eukprot:TRINITY_DN1227_c0_g2_i1.p1 TRINITY_DN1227_c0_g2~~TRINITY_DN1227_c0_g2_i1.p1  ORF type:complete len:414 (+),score=73.19 TRINITY_DN1227_c0_g2_i1:174-1244(+)
MAEPTYQITKLIEVHPNHPHLRIVRAKIFLQEGHVNAATSDLQFYFNVVPKGERSLEALVMWGVIYDLLFELDKAIQTFTEAIELYQNHFPGHPYALSTTVAPKTCLMCTKKIPPGKFISCESCSTELHLECAQTFQPKCKIDSPDHQLISRKIHIPTHCAVCKGTLTRLSGEVRYCIYCDNTVHVACSKASFPCKNTSKPVVTLSDLYNYRGLSLYHNSKYAEAIKDFTTAIELSTPEEVQGVFFANRGLAFSMSEELELAISDFTYAISNNFVNAEILQFRANAYQLKGMVKEADEDRHRAHELDTSVILNVFVYPIPRDVLFDILGHLSMADLVNCRKTCKKWKKAVEDLLIN